MTIGQAPPSLRPRATTSPTVAMNFSA